MSTRQRLERELADLEATADHFTDAAIAAADACDTDRERRFLTRAEIALEHAQAVRSRLARYRRVIVL